MANRYIIRSLRCLIGVVVSPDGPAGFCGGFEMFPTPLGAGEFDDRWVIGLVPCVHAFWGRGFLQNWLISIAQKGPDSIWWIESWSAGQLHMLKTERGICRPAPSHRGIHVTGRTSHEENAQNNGGVEQSSRLWQQKPRRLQEPVGAEKKS